MGEVTLDQWAVPLADVQVDEDVVAAALESVRSGWWSMGPRVEAFEDEFARFVEAEHAIAVANGTAALHLALLAAGVRAGDEVVLPSLNFVAAANVVVHTGARPVFCDISGGADLNLDPSDLEAAVSERTRAVILLHYGGFACDLQPVLELARARGIAIVEDAAHAPGSTWRGRPCGTIGDVGCFSFFPNKNLPVGEGGMIVTNDAELAATIRLLRSHGMTTLTWDRHRGHASSYDVVTPGFNFRLDEVRAAIGSARLARISDENTGRARLAARYRDALEGEEGVSLAFGERLGERESAHHLAVAILPEGVDREAVRAVLTEARIQTSVHYPPIHRFSAYRGGDGSRPLPRTEAIADRIVTLPLFGHMTEAQQDLVTSTLLAAVAGRTPAPAGA